MVVIGFVSFEYSSKNQREMSGVIKKGMQCNQVVDMIYEQCREESKINITSIKGHNTTLRYENGVCVIK